MWELILVAGLPALMQGGLTWLVLREKRKRVDEWEETVKSLGFRVTERSRSYGWFVKLEGQQGAMRVRIEDSRRKGHDARTRVILSVPGPPGSAGLRIRREGTYKTGAREIEIGDKAFDETFSIEGPMRVAALLLDAEVRGILTDLNALCRRIGIIGHEMVVELNDVQIPDILPMLMKIGERFSREMDVPQSLAHNARQDQEPGVRLLNLRFLVREFPGETLTTEVLRQACSDPSPRVRLLAARGLGDEGRDVLLKLADDMEIDECSAQAISALGKAMPFERARDLLPVALRRRRLQTAQACLRSLVQSGQPVAVDMLASLLDREDGELAADAALALGETGNPEAEAPLIHALRTGRSDIRAAAAKALGRAGSAAAVLPLKEAEENLAWDSELRRAARQSIAEIQSRLPGASHGQLSLAGEEAGQLSIADAEAGQLSLTVDSAGQLSLPDGETPQRPERTSD
ncbi:MAG TPA: HEAT repeat domain-containing protein [Thermoanaerobaculia bacterium]|jgi:HEAT repeat protein|nr:HEAT repeat domain-containing protein [Thermoanaerobaculia bacterium]